jgi:uncharacterized protein (DUF1501 family)
MHLTRRYFLQSTGALAAYLGITPLDLFAASGRTGLVAPTVTKGKTLVVIFLRGGADGLNLIVPHGDSDYTKIRPTIAIPGPASAGEAGTKAIDLDGFYGLHPRLSPLAPFFEEGLAVAAHAVGYDKNTRSHFEEQDTWETGIVGNTVASDGWVNRHLATSEGRGTIRAVSIGDNLPRILHGKAAAYAIRGLDDLGMNSKGVDPAKVAAALEHAYCTPDPRSAADRRSTQSNARDLLNTTARNTLEGLDELKAVVGVKYEPVKPYPKTDIGNKLLQMARLIKADVGLEVGEIDYGGWDTHQSQGRGSAGAFADLAGNLAEALAAFRADLGDKMDDVLVVTLTDFGRTAAENGTTGTDHGWANCMLLLGGPVARANATLGEGGKARKVVTTGPWPGLSPDQLHQKRDLLHTTDFRDVLCELVRVHLGNPHLETVLPQHEFKRVGLIA